MNEPRKPSQSIATQILTGAGGGENKMRYLFRPDPARPGYVCVYDMQTQQPVADLVDDHARMVYLMYSNLYQRHPFAADEFVYGHILGWTLTLLHIDKYPKFNVIRNDDGSVTIKTVVNGLEVTAEKVSQVTDLEKEMIRRVVGNKLEDPGA